MDNGGFTKSRASISWTTCATYRSATAASQRIAVTSIHMPITDTPTPSLTGASAPRGLSTLAAWGGHQGRPVGAFWLLLGADGVCLRRSDYALDRAVERIRATGYPEA